MVRFQESACLFWLQCEWVNNHKHDGWVGPAQTIPMNQEMKALTPGSRQYIQRQSLSNQGIPSGPKPPGLRKHTNKKAFNPHLRTVYCTNIKLRHDKGTMKIIITRKLIFHLAEINSLNAGMTIWKGKKIKMISHQQNGWQIHCISIIFGNYIVTCMKVREWDDYRRASVLLLPWKKRTRKYWFALLFIWQTYSIYLVI